MIGKILFSFLIGLGIQAQGQLLSASTPTEKQLTEVADYQMKEAVRLATTAQTQLQKMGLSRGSYRNDCNTPIPNSQGGLEADPVSQTYICLPPEADVAGINQELQEIKQEISTVPPEKFEKGNDFVTTRYSLTHINDADLLRTLRTGYLNDDTGRTAELNGKIEKIREDGSSVWVEMGSVGFGQREKVNGKWRDPQGKLYLRFLNIDRIIAGGTKTSSQTESVANRYIVEGEIERHNPNGGIMRNLQNSLHKRLYPAKPEEGKLGFTYHYLPDLEAEKRTFATFKAGLQKQIQTDLGKFHCVATGTVMGGGDTEGRLVGQVRGEATVSTGSHFGRDKDNPVLALTVYADKLARTSNGPYNDNRSEKGATLKGSIKISDNVYVEPSLGYVYYNSVTDKRYAINPQKVQTNHGGQEKLVKYGVSIVVHKNML